ncbi:Biotin synthase [Sporomusa carbonis]|uniref:biotin synthase BioB n=1 Tax=Sporomusa carbonis TaxID=3076075 RepID=UPI003A6A434C
MSYDLVFELGKKVLDGGQLTFDEAMKLTQIDKSDIPILLGIANKIRAKFTGNQVDTCEIVNARSGGCSEDCKFCAQSAHHNVKLDIYPLMNEEQILHAAKKAESHSAYRFCIVTAGCGMKNDPDFEQIIESIKRIGIETGLKRCCSLGILSPDHVKALKAAGITRYHHNLETSQSFFNQICTTHTYDERIETIKHVKAEGLEVCSGGIIGLGETWEHRIELAFALKELDVDSVPINVLNPVKGTALENQPPLKPMEILQTFAIFRMILPTKILRYAGGREKALGELVPLGFLAGINGMLIGNYLTTTGRGATADLDTVRDLGLKPIAE